MKIFGLDITRAARREEKALQPASNRGGWWPIFREVYAGAWQRNVEVSYDSVLSYHADFACRTLIASDVAKLRVKLVQRDSSGIWAEVDNFNFHVIARPNRYQTRIQFFESWVLSKLQRGNTYVLKQRGEAGAVVGLHVLDPTLVTPLIADNGDVYYELNTDNLAGLTGRLVVPASEIIHDRFNCFFHPLVGLSPIFASGLAAMQGLAIQNNSTRFFQNGSQPGGILTAPGAIADDTAARLKAYWETAFSGANAGKVAVVGDGLKYEALTAKAVDAQLIEQLKWTAEVVCSCYHVPPYKIGVGALPSYNNVQALNVEYYSQCLQVHIEAIELLLDDGLGLRGEVGTRPSLGVEFDIEGLLRMDSGAQFDALEKAKSVLTLNERRRKVDGKPIDGGDTVFMQQQDHSLEAITARDAQIINPASGGDVQAEALNGAQITALQGLAMSAAAGEVPIDTVEAIISASFPLLTPQQVEEIVAPLKVVGPSDDDAEDEPPVDDETDDDAISERFMAALATKLAKAELHA